MPWVGEGRFCLFRGEVCVLLFALQSVAERKARERDSESPRLDGACLRRIGFVEGGVEVRGACWRSGAPVEHRAWAGSVFLGGRELGSGSQRAGEEHTPAGRRCCRGREGKKEGPWSVGFQGRSDEGTGVALVRIVHIGDVVLDRRAGGRVAGRAGHNRQVDGGTQIATRPM